jgi:hypothetical protein
MPEFSDLITSRVRVKLIELFYSDITEMYHIREVTRQVKEEINAVRRELANLEKSGVLKKENRGNRVYYWARIEYAFYSDLLSMVAKSTGLGSEIINSRKKIGRVNFVMFSGKFVRRKERKRDDEVDILMVGDVVLPELATLIRMEESRRKHEINYTVMSREELDYRKKRRDPFLLGILSGGRVMIIGDEETLVG